MTAKSPIGNNNHERLLELSMPSGKLFKAPRKEDVQASIDACLANAERLMEDAVQLEFQERGGARLAICMLAQEEYAKAFLLYMVREELFPWDTELLRAIRNHACKHLVAIVMEYVDPQWETLEELDAIIKSEFDLEGHFPPRVSSALNILYYEKMRRGDFFDDNDYEPDVVAVAAGERDMVKQDAIYVDLDKSCRVKNAPMNVSREDAELEYRRAGRYGSTILGLIRPDAYEGIQLKKLKEATKIVFWQKYKPVDGSAET
jgi:AbiV family abortive infection protein